MRSVDVEQQVLAQRQRRQRQRGVDLGIGQQHLARRQGIGVHVVRQAGAGDGRGLVHALRRGAAIRTGRKGDKASDVHAANDNAPGRTNRPGALMGTWIVKKIRLGRHPPPAHCAPAH
jgi:hypothetical protein